MTQLLLDQFWTNTLHLLQAHLKDGEAAIVPDEFVEILPNSSPYSQTQTETDGFSWIVVHKGRIDRLNLELLVEAFNSFSPVLANEVFVVFSKSEALTPIESTAPHLESLLVQVIEASSAAIRKRLPVKKSGAVEGGFDDVLWDAPLNFITKHADADDRLLLPDEFCYLFDHASSYYETYTEEQQEFDWVLIHKGRLIDLTLKFLSGVFRSLSPVFANNVFVLFSNSKALPKLSYTSRHVRSLFRGIILLKANQAINAVTGLLPGTPETVVDKQKLSILTRQENPEAHWFSRDRYTYAVPLCWAATTAQYPFANLGDALSPIIVSALSGIPSVHQFFDARQRRLASVGTIGHELRNGAVHLWGTGVDGTVNPVDPTQNSYKRPAKTTFHVHALRGPKSARVLRSQGIEVPDIYGDPVWFLPSIFKPAAEKRYELGVIVHLSELTAFTDTAGVDARVLRYKIPEALSGSIRIITTAVKPTFEALEERLEEITACKRILSTSLHGLVIAETYRIPCLYFRTLGEGLAYLHLNDETEYMNERMRDFYSGVGLEKLTVYGQHRFQETDWDAAIRAIDTHWSPIYWSPDAFLETFPLPLTFNPLQGEAFNNYSLLKQIKL